jgi:indole-3-glycerol phosphate synthase
VQAARGKPVLARDWIIHPLQLAEAKEAGAAGVLGVIGQVNGRGTAVMSSFGAALGLDCPVEVVNARVRQQTSDWGSGVQWCEKEGPREAWDGGAEVGG